MKTYQISFFDESKRLAALSRLGDPLEQLLKHVDFEIFRPILNEAFRKADRKSPAGRKPLDVILMFKAMVIQRLFNPNSEVKKYRFVRKAVAERGCDTKSNLNPRTKQCSQSFTRFSVPAKFNCAAP
jgi:hypothetical protein